MRHRLLTAPWWVLALFQGTFFGVFMALFTRLYDSRTYGGGVTGFVIQALVTGVPFGLLMGFITARANRRATAATGLDDSYDMVAASRASVRGPVPTDPRLRAAARDLAVHRLEQFRRKRTSTLAVFVVATIGYLAGAIFASPWWALGALLFLGFLVQSLLLPTRLERRIRLLSDAPGEPASPAVSPER